MSVGAQSSDFRRIRPPDLTLMRVRIPDLAADPIDAIDGFEGSAEQLQDLVEQIDWN